MTSNNINSNRTIFAIVWLAVIGPCVFILQPGFIQGLVAYLGFNEQQAAQIASYEMFGIAATTVLLSFVSTKVPWRRFLQGCLVVCVLGNLASIGQTDFNTLSTIRFVTGLGSGGLVSLTFTMMGLTTHADRNFGWIVTGVLTYGAFGMLLMPTAFELIGMNGIYVFFALFCVTGFLFFGDLPDSGTEIELTPGDIAFSNLLKTVSLAAVLVYNIAIGVVWAYLFLVGIDAGMGEQAVANALTLSQFLGIVGAFTAVALDLRLGRMLPLMIGVLGGALSIYILMGDIDNKTYWLGVCGFNLLWNLAMPYILAMLADFDHRGRVVVHGVSMQFIGFAVGPFIAAQLVVRGGYDMANGTAVILFVISAGLMLPGLLAQRKKMWLAKTG